MGQQSVATYGVKYGQLIMTSMYVCGELYALAEIPLADLCPHCIASLWERC